MVLIYFLFFLSLLLFELQLYHLQTVIWGEGTTTHNLGEYFSNSLFPTRLLFHFLCFLLFFSYCSHVSCIDIENPVACHCEPSEKDSVFCFLHHQQFNYYYYYLLLFLKYKYKGVLYNVPLSFFRFSWQWHWVLGPGDWSNSGSIFRTPQGNHDAFNLQITKPISLANISDQMTMTEKRSAFHAVNRK